MSLTWQIQKFKIHCSLTARLSRESPWAKCKSVFNNIQIKSQRLSMWSKWDKLLHWSVWQISAVEQAEKIIQKFQVRGSLTLWKMEKMWSKKRRVTLPLDWGVLQSATRSFLHLQCLILMCCFSCFPEAAFNSLWSQDVGHSTGNTWSGVKMRIDWSRRPFPKLVRFCR